MARVERPPMGMAGVSLTEEMIARLDRLRAVYGKPRSWVIETALAGGGVPKLERDNSDLVARFNRLAERRGTTWQDAAYTYGVTYGRRANPPTVPELEVDSTFME